MRTSYLVHETATAKDAGITREAADHLFERRRCGGTSIKGQRMDAPTCVRTYKSLAQVERAFRSLKATDLKLRPIHHHVFDPQSVKLRMDFVLRSV